MKRSSRSVNKVVVFIIVMHFLVHLLVGILAALSLNLPPVWFFIFIVASVAIDLDHFLEWNKFFKPRDRDALINPAKFSKDINYRTLQQSLHIFHTFEILALIFILSNYFYFFWIVGLAFSLHIIFDAIGNIWNRNIMHKGKEGWLKYWFLTRYILKRDVYTHQK